MEFPFHYSVHMDLYLNLTEIVTPNLSGSLRYVKIEVSLQIFLCIIYMDQ